MWVGLLISYVANVANVRPSKSPLKGDFSFWHILRHILAYFVTAFSVQKPYLCTEFQSALKPPKTNTRICEPPYLPAAQPKHKGRV